MAVWAQQGQQQQLYSAKSNTAPDFPSSCQTQSPHRRTSQGWDPTGLNPSSHSSHSTGKVTGIRMNHGDLWKTVKMLTYQCHWLYLAMLSVDLISCTIALEESFPVISKAHSSQLPIFQLEKNSFFIYSGQNSWVAEISLSPHKHRNHYHHSHKFQTCANGWD